MIDLTNKKSLYRIYKIKTGKKERLIYDPNPILREEQQILFNKLNHQYNPPSCVYGYIKGRNIKDAVASHVNKKFVITFDIKNFFPSITNDKLLKLGLSDYESELCTYNNQIVLGTSVAPLISNMYLKSFDCYIESFCAIHRIRYSRYSDDLSFSSNYFSYNILCAILEEKLGELGLQLNSKKTKIMSNKDRQIVLGVTVNNKPSVNKIKRKELRAKLYNSNLSESDIGYLNYINSVNSEQYKCLINQY